MSHGCRKYLSNGLRKSSPAPSPLSPLDLSLSFLPQAAAPDPRRPKPARRRSKVATPFKVFNTAVAVLLRPGRLLRARRCSSGGPRARVRSLMASPPPHGVQLRARPPPWHRYSSPRGRAGSGRHPLNGRAADDGEYPPAIPPLSPPPPIARARGSPALVPRQISSSAPPSPSRSF